MNVTQERRGQMTGAYCSYEFRCGLSEPVLQLSVRLEFHHLDAVDGRAYFAHFPDVVLAHLAKP